MVTPQETLWPIEPHTKAKHEILRRYLEAWFPILKSWNGKVVYFDGFCGPGKYEAGEDGSPLIALDVAMNHAHLEGNIDFWFNDIRKDRIENLEKEIDVVNPPERFERIITNYPFEKSFEMLFEKLKKPGNIEIPTFAFIDPFGFKELSYEQIEKFLNRKSCEVLITLMVDSVNRWLNHPKDEIREHCVKAFGTNEVLKLIDVEDRIYALKRLYLKQIQKIVKFVRYFEMCDYQNRPIYYLFFASNSRHGHIKMKEAMWKVNPDGQYRFSDKTSLQRSIEYDNYHAEELLKDINDIYIEGWHDAKDIQEYVEDDTGYLNSHKTEALRIAEKENIIEVKSQKKDGTKRRKGSFPPGVEIRFK